MSTSAEPSFRITPAKGAYAVALPAGLIAKFPPLFRARITLGTGEDRPRHALDATCETAGEVLVVTADPSAVQMPFAVTDSTTFDIDAYGIDDPARQSTFWSTPIAEIEGKFRFSERRRCSGCSRDPNLEIYIDDSICWCFSQVMEA